MSRHTYSMRTDSARLSSSAGGAVTRYLSVLFTPRITMKRMALITLQWSMLYKSGVPMARCFVVVAEQSRDRIARHTLIRVADALEAGATLEESLRSESHRLPPMFVEALSCAEASGRFDDALDHVCQYFEDWLEHRRAIIRAAAYPFFVLMAIMFGIPLAKSVAISVLNGGTDSDFMRLLLMWFKGVLAFFVPLFLIVGILSRTGIWQWVWGAAATFIWPFGKIVRRYAHARFFRMLGILLGGGMAPKTAVRRAATLVTNPILAADINRALPMLDRCATLEEALSRAQLLPPVARESLAMGEQTGRGPELFEKTAKWLHDEADHRLRTLIWSIEGILILMLAAMIVMG